MLHLPINLRHIGSMKILYVTIEMSPEEVKERYMSVFKSKTIYGALKSPGSHVVDKKRTDLQKSSKDKRPTPKIISGGE